MYQIRTPGAALRDARLKAKMSQADLAKKAGTSQSYVVKIEQNTVDPRISTLARIFEILGFEIIAIAKPLMPTVQSLLTIPNDEHQRSFLNILPEEHQ